MTQKKRCAKFKSRTALCRSLSIFLFLALLLAAKWARGASILREDMSVRRRDGENVLRALLGRDARSIRGIDGGTDIPGATFMLEERRHVYPGLSRLLRVLLFFCC